MRLIIVFIIVKHSCNCYIFNFFFLFFLGCFFHLLLSGITGWGGSWSSSTEVLDKISYIGLSEGLGEETRPVALNSVA